MPNGPLCLLSAVLALATPAVVHAADEKEAWTTTDSALRSDAAGISLPQTVATLSLSKSGEASNGGKGVDNYAQYLSDDGAIQATLYIYLPSYADASLAAHMTDRAIMERFGSRTRRSSYTVAPAGGEARGAIRAVYDDAQEGALTTAAAFIHAGRWIVKLRVTGPAQRRKDVLAGLDGMLKGLRFDQPDSIHSTALASFASCPGKDEADARLTRQIDNMQPHAAQPLEEGKPLCVRSQVQTAEGSYEMLQQAGVENGAVIVPIDDAGTILTFDPSPAGQGYQLSIHSIGQTDLYGVYDKVPSPRQIAQIIDGKDPQTAQAQRTADYAANGDVTMRGASVAR